MESALQQALGYLRQQVSAIPQIFAQRKQNVRQANLLPRKGYKYVPETNIQAPIGSRLLPKNRQRVRTKAKTPLSTPTVEEIAKAIELGSEDAPIATFSGQIAKEQAKYPIFEKFPFLTVGQSQLESRGLKDFTEQPELVYRPKQALGWGVFVPSYNPLDVQLVLNDFISAIGGRSGDQYTPTQIRTSQIYKPFRQTGDLNWYANKYAGPITAQNPQAGDIYASNLATVMNKYAGVLDRLMQERGASFPGRY